MNRMWRFDRLSAGLISRSRLRWPQGQLFYDGVVVTLTKNLFFSFSFNLLVFGHFIEMYTQQVGLCKQIVREHYGPIVEVRVRCILYNKYNSA